MHIFYHKAHEEHEVLLVMNRDFLIFMVEMNSRISENHILVVFAFSVFIRLILIVKRSMLAV